MRESGMPDEAFWETLFDVELILDRLGVDRAIKDVFEMGCGYGTFTIPVARRVAGAVETVDIDPAMVERTRRRAEEAGLKNVLGRVRDVFADGFGVADESVGGCLLFNILHCEEPVRLLVEAARSLRPGGLVYVIHWRHDPTTPRGPNMSIRPRPAQIQTWATDAGLHAEPSGVIDLPPYHYGMVFGKR